MREWRKSKQEIKLGSIRIWFVAGLVGALVITIALLITGNFHIFFVMFWIIGWSLGVVLIRVFLRKFNLEE